MFKTLLNILSIYKYYYYYKRDGCPANSCNDKNCFCWWEQWSGPHAYVRNDNEVMLPYDINYPKPSKMNLTWKKKINKLKVSFYLFLLIIISLLIYV